MATPQDSTNSGVIPQNPLSGGVVNPALIKSDFKIPEPNFGGSGGAGQSQPQQGLAPDLKKMISQGQQMGDQLKSSITGASEYGKNQFYYATPRSVNADQFQRYYSHPSYDKLGYTPWRDNEQIYNDNSSGWADFRRASGQWWSLFGTGFKSNVRSWGDLIDGKPLKEDLDSAEEFQKIMQIGSSTRGGVAGFMSNTWLNSGYTFGIIGEMLAEEVVLAGVTALSGFSSSEVTVPAMGARLVQSMGKIGKGFQLMKGLSKSLAAMKEINAAKTFWAAARKTGEFLNPLENTTKFFTQSENLNSLAKNSNLFGSFYRDLREVNFALSESKLEGGSAYLDESQALTDRFYQENGRMPVGKELDDIIEVSKSAAYATTLANLPTIYYTNKLTFDGLFKGINPLERTTAEFISKAGSKIQFDKRALTKGLDPFKYVESNLKSVAKSFINPRTYAKAGINYFKGNFSEGLQESLQDVISGAAKDYYTGVYENHGKKAMDDVIGNITSNMAAQFSSQGLETFLGGFVMGSLVKPITSMPGWATAGYNKYFKPEQYQQYKEAKEKYTNQMVTNLNEMYKDPLKYFGSGIVNIGAQSEIATKLHEAEKFGDTKAFHDLKDASLYEHIWTALDTGTMDIFMKRIGEIKNMDAETAKEAFNVEDGQEAISRVDSIVSRAKNIEENYKFWQNRAPNPFDPKKFKRDSPEYIDEAISSRAWEMARKHAVFMNYSFSRTLERMKGVMQDASDSKPLEKASSRDFTLLFDPNTIDSEISLLKNETENAMSVSDPSLKRILSNKKAKLKRLESYRDKLDTYRGLIGFEEMTGSPFTPEALKVASRLRESYKKYVSVIADISGDRTLDENINKAFNKMQDFYSLDLDSHNLSQAVNMLTDPEGFAEHFQRNTEMLRELYNNKEESIRRGIEETVAKKEANTLLNQLYEKSAVMNAEDLEKFLADGTIPDMFYDIANKVAITKDDPRYSELIAVLKQHEQATKEEPKPEEATEQTTPEAAASISSATLWEELPAALRSKLEPLWEEYRAENLVDKEEYELERYRQNWLATPKALELIISYNIENKLKSSKRRPLQNVPTLRTKKVADGKGLEEMTIAELNSILRQLVELDKKPVEEGKVDINKDERKLDIQDLEDYIAQRRGMAPRNKPAKVMAIVDRIEEMQKVVQGRSEDNSHYIINGEPYRRVTTVIEPVEHDYNGTKPFMYHRLAQAIEVFFRVQTEGGGAEQFMKIFEGGAFPEFNKRKNDILRKALEENFDVDVLREQLNELSYDGSRVAGNTLDTLVRDFLQDKPISKPDNMTEKSYDTLVARLNQIRDNMFDKDLTLLAHNIVVYDTDLKIAGEIDILAIDKDGEVYIYDVKSAKKNSWDQYDNLKSNKSNRIKHSLQVSAYGNLLYNSYGITPKGYGIIPLEITYDLDGNIDTLKANKTIKLNYLPDVEEVVPRKQTTVATPEVVTIPEPVAPEGTMGIEEIQEAIDMSETPEQLDKVRLMILEKYSAGEVEVPGNHVSRMIEVRKQALLKNLDIYKLEEGDILIMSGPEQELYKIVEIQAERTTFEKLNSPDEKSLTMKNSDIPLKFEGKWSKDMKTTANPEPTEKEKALINDSGNIATDFLGDKARLQQIADAAEKNLNKKDSMDNLLNNLDC